MVDLPRRPDLDQLRRQAKQLRKAAAEGLPEAVARVSAVSDHVSLAATQLVLAREHGFRSWPALKAAVKAETAPAMAPLVPGKHLDQAVRGAGDFVEWAQSEGWSPGGLPVGAIFTSQTFLTTYLEQQPERFRVSGELTPANGQVFLTATDPIVAVACLGTGASAAVSLLEHLVGLGVDTFVSVGPAPAVATALEWGDCIVANAALRDDGISQHYVEPARYAHPHTALTQRVTKEASAAGLDPVLGSVWTVPTPYRTTASELEAYRAEGVLATDLITAALFAIGAALNVKTASALVATRTLGPPGPLPSPERTTRIFTLLDATIRAVASGYGGRE